MQRIVSAICDLRKPAFDLVQTCCHVYNVVIVATWPSGKAELCKSSITGSIPVVASASGHLATDALIHFGG
jgi:hypothetical protein